MAEDSLYPDEIDGVHVHRVGRENRAAVWRLDLTTLDRQIATAWLLRAFEAAESANATAVLAIHFANGVTVELPWKHRSWLPVGRLARELRVDEDVVDWLRGWALSTTGDGSPIDQARGPATAVHVNIRRNDVTLR